MLKRSMLVLWALSTTVAHAEIDPQCAGLTIPADYDEQVQQDFIQNYFALATSFSPLHGPVPHEPGRGAIGIDANFIPPLGCERRFVLNYTKTEDTNKTPILPRIRATFSLPEFAKNVSTYAGVGFLPPLSINGTRNLVASGEAGVGGHIPGAIDVGGRFHTSLQRTYGDVATAFNADDPVIEDAFFASTWGLDVILGKPIGDYTPYLSVGWLDASTFFLVGDTGFVSSNLHPYSGPVLSAGADALLVDRVRVAAEFYAAPGGVTERGTGTTSVDTISRYGRLYTGRVRIGYEF